MQKTVIINRGIPASGKSTFTKEIVNTFEKNGLSAISCSTDNFFMIDGKYHFDASKLRKYHIKNQELFKSSLQNNLDLVICDNTNIEPWEAKPYYEMAKEYKYDVILMNFSPRDIVKHFAIQTQDDNYQHTIPLDKLYEMETSYKTYQELLYRSSFPTSKQPKRKYTEETNSVEISEELSELFYYDYLITISAKDYLSIKEIIGETIIKKIRTYSLDEINLIPSIYKKIIQEFNKKSDKTLTAYDLKIPNGPIDKSIKQIERDIEKLQDEFHNIITKKVGRKKGYKLIDNFDILIDSFMKNDDIVDLIYLAEESDIKLFERFEYKTLKEESIYLFKNSIYEKMENRDIFNNLKGAIKLNEYRKIQFKNNETFYEIKCIKLVFIDNNWYLAYSNSNDILKLGRISFIKEVKYTTKNSYQRTSIQKHLDNLKKNLQNSMTLFDVEPKLATIQATSNIAKYFEKDMKKFLSTQNFKKKLEDDSVIFTLKYTQPLEILPFIKKWMPDLIILEPKELKNEYIISLEKTIKLHQK